MRCMREEAWPTHTVFTAFLDVLEPLLSACPPFGVRIGFPFVIRMTGQHCADGTRI